MMRACGSEIIPHVLTAQLTSWEMMTCHYDANRSFLCKTLFLFVVGVFPPAATQLKLQNHKTDFRTFASCCSYDSMFKEDYHQCIVSLQVLNHQVSWSAPSAVR